MTLIGSEQTTSSLVVMIVSLLEQEEAEIKPLTSLAEPGLLNDKY